MIHLFVVYDDQDRNIGNYFTTSQDHLCKQINDLTHLNIQNFDSIDTRQQVEAAISNLNQQHNEASFVIVTYAHGSPDALHIGSDNVVDTTNAYLFGQTLFYAVGCHAGTTLKQHLMDNNCKFFMGYMDSITTLYLETEPLFYTCENSVLAHFLSTEQTIQECIAFMYDTYEQISAETDIRTANILQSNLSRFIYDGDISLTRHDFMLHKNYS